MKTTKNQYLNIGDTYKYNSTKNDIDSFTFTIFQINQDNVDVIVNKSQYSKIKISEFKNPNLIKI